MALTNVGLFGGVRQTGIVPDFLLSLEVELPPDRGIKEDRAYYIWEYGKCPDLVVEVVSNNEGDEDFGKFVDYARMGIPYYLIYDRRGILSKDEIRIFELGPARRYRRRKSHWINCSQWPMAEGQLPDSEFPGMASPGADKVCTG